VAFEGTSLTVNAVDSGTFEVLLIPHTLKVTTWGERNAGDTVNIEVDQMARYAARLMDASAYSRPHVGAFAGSRRRPDFQHLAARRIEEPLAGEAPASRRSVERAALVAALAEKEPDQKERETEADGQAKRDHETGSITAAVP
jgi:hypothetical protein